jgi:hypothetical protein
LSGARSVIPEFSFLRVNKSLAHSPEFREDLGRYSIGVSKSEPFFHAKTIEEVAMTCNKRIAALRVETDCAVKSLILQFSPIDKHRRYLAKLNPDKIKLHLSWIVRNLKQIDALQGGVRRNAQNNRRSHSQW